MSLLVDTLALARSGRTVIEIADDLDLPTDLAASLVDHWVRLGRIERADAQCAPTALQTSERPVACASCPIAAGCLSATTRPRG